MKLFHFTDTGIGYSRKVIEAERVLCVGFIVTVLLLTVFDTVEKAKEWLDTSNVDLDNVTPQHVINENRVDIIRDLLEDMLLGHPN